METGVFQVTLNGDGSATLLCSQMLDAAPTMGISDGRCDPQGRFLARSMYLNMSLWWGKP